MVTDWPSVNLMVRTNTFQAVGGYNTDLWPGEDTVFCSNLYDYHKTKILYLPNLVVFHHRRQGLFGHLKQVSTYGRQRGHLARNGDYNSLTARYFLPSGLVLFLAGNALASQFQLVDWLLLTGWTIYGITLFKSLYDISSILPVPLAVISTLLIFPTHISYGLGFLIGLMGSQPVVRLR